MSLPQSGDLSHPKYRPDIDGLRAIAVLSVVFCHAFPARVPGGFIGVDIFFVISGFLITSIILGSFDGDGFSYRTFYARRIRRIFPALILVMTATLVAGWFLLLPDEWEQLGSHLAGSAGFASNFVFWHEAGYFDTASETKLLLHLWSLAIEEQFYIVWPLLLGLAWWRGWPVLPVLVAGALLSFGINVALVVKHKEAAFYAPWARAWELMAGGILACLRLHAMKPRLPWPPAMRAHVQSTAGIALIALGLIFLRPDKAFPGWWALLPVLGAALCIAAGPDGWFNRRVLAWRPVVWVGLISYPLYLWHWPLLAFTRLLDNAKPLRATGVLLLSFILAWLTYRFVERRWRHSRGTKTVAALCIGMAGLGLGGGLIVGDQWSGRIGFTDPFSKIALQAKDDWDSLMQTRIGVGPRKILVMGDSHVAQYEPRLQALLAQDLKETITIDVITSSGCPMIPHVTGDYADTDCPEVRNIAFENANKNDFDTVVIGGAWNRYFIPFRKFDFEYVTDNIRLDLHGERGTEMALREMGQQISAWVAQNKKVYVLLDNPTGVLFEPRQLIRDLRWSGQFFSSTAPWPPEQARLHARMREMALSNGAQVIDPVAALCSDGQCIRALPDGSPVYKDEHHLRASYVRDHAIWMDVLVAP